MEQTALGLKRNGIDIHGNLDELKSIGQPAPDQPENHTAGGADHPDYGSLKEKNLPDIGAGSAHGDHNSDIPGFFHYHKDQGSDDI